MNEYIILYDGDEVFKVKSENEIAALIDLFAWSENQSEWTLSELKDIGERYGFEKLIKIFEKTENTKIDFYKVEPIYLAEDKINETK